MTWLNFILDNDITFYGIFIGAACHAGFSFWSSILYDNKVFIDSAVQTDTWEDYSDRPSQIMLDSLTSLDTVTPRISLTEYISKIVTRTTFETGIEILSGDTSTVTTVLPIPPVNIEVIPNPDI